MAFLVARPDDVPDHGKSWVGVTVEITMIALTGPEPYGVEIRTPNKTTIASRKTYDRALEIARYVTLRLERLGAAVITSGFDRPPS